MRLIDADELIKDRVENDPVVVAAKCAPTAYDVDKVVRAIERVSITEDKVMYVNPDCFCKFVKLKDAVKIAKSGGIE